jgi:hypothetical protein
MQTRNEIREQMRLHLKKLDAIRAEVDKFLAMQLPVADYEMRPPHSPAAIRGAFDKQQEWQDDYYRLCQEEMAALQRER